MQVPFELIEIILKHLRVPKPTFTPWPISEERADSDKEPGVTRGFITPSIDDSDEDIDDEDDSRTSGYPYW